MLKIRLVFLCSVQSSQICCLSSHGTRGVSNDADEFHPLDGYTLQIVLFSILVAAMISMGMLVWCADFVRKHLVKWTFHTTTPAGVKEVMQKISDLGNTEKREIVRQLMTKTTESEDCLLQEISSLRAKVQTLSEGIKSDKM